MPVNWELLLISKIIYSGQLKEVIRRGITPADLTNPNCSEALEKILTNYIDFGTVLSKEMFFEKMGPVELPRPTRDSLEAILDQVQSALLENDINNLQVSIAEVVEAEPFSALDRLQAGSTTLSGRYSDPDDMVIGDGMSEVQEEYYMVKEQKGLTGIPWRFDILNTELGGIHEEDFIVFYARPKNAKTWMLLAEAVHKFERGYKTLIETKEMSKKALMRRCAAIIAKLDYRRFRQGKLTTLEEQRFNQVVKDISKNKRLIISAQKSGGRRRQSGGGVTALRAKIEEVSPDIVFLDGIYLMRDDRSTSKTSDWRAMYNITQDLKELAQSTKIPIIGTTQQNRSAVKAKNKGGSDVDDIAYADSFGQDADLIIRLRFNKSEGYIDWVLTGARETALYGFRARARLAQDLRFLGLIEENYEEDQNRKDGVNEKRTADVYNPGEFDESDMDLTVEMGRRKKPK
ncbi:hypothetical protein LCGC14_0147240 [marine sediment metagenome]|uniref:SF4 helicase domain-containing protein n=1 Tax=marine sediment metagenome TaxID=412755 RepID=A0A0F9VFP5_9ZZZZ